MKRNAIYNAKEVGHCCLSVRGTAGMNYDVLFSHMRASEHRLPGAALTVWRRCIVQTSSSSSCCSKGSAAAGKCFAALAGRQCFSDAGRQAGRRCTQLADVACCRSAPMQSWATDSTHDGTVWVLPSESGKVMAKVRSGK